MVIKRVDVKSNYQARASTEHFNATSTAAPLYAVPPQSLLRPLPTTAPSTSLRNAHRDLNTTMNGVRGVYAYTLGLVIAPAVLGTVALLVVIAVACTTAASARRSSEISRDARRVGYTHPPMHMSKSSQAVPLLYISTRVR